MTSDQFAGCHGCVQIPWALSATSVAYNLSGAVPHLRMSGPVLAKIFLGTITTWNDPAIKKLNPGKTLPSEKITPIFRSDSSGTTYNFTEYLSSVSREFGSKVGKGTQVNFPTGGVGGKGSSGVAAVLARTNGGITYVDVAYSLRSHFSFFAMQNKAGQFTLPGLRGIAGAAATIRKVPANNELSIVNPPKGYKEAYPICTFTYVILPLKTSKAPQLRKFVFWALTGGQKYGPKLPLLADPQGRAGEGREVDQAGAELEEPLDRPVEKRRDERGRRDRQHPRGDDVPGDAPADGREPFRRAGSHHGARHDVRRRERIAGLRRGPDRGSGRGLGGETALGLEREDPLAPSCA